MNNYKHKSAWRTFTAMALEALTAIVLLGATASLCAAQDQTQQTPSTDRDNPTALTSNVITADGVDEKTEYFYSFTAGPGDVTITLDVKAQKNTAVSSVDIVLYDRKSKSLLSTYANPDHGSSKRAVETAKVRGTETLLLEVTVSPGVDNFKIKLDGAVQITPPAPTDSTTPAATPTPTPDDVPQQPQSDAGGSADGNATTAGATDKTATGPGGDAAAPTGMTSGDKTTKVNKKINSAAAKLSAIINYGSSTADSVKTATKKKQ